MGKNVTGLKWSNFLRVKTHCLPETPDFYLVYYAVMKLTYILSTNFLIKK